MWCHVISLLPRSDYHSYVIGFIFSANVLCPQIYEFSICKAYLQDLFHPSFQVLPVILFFSFCIQILYYYGVMQWVVIKMGWFLQVTVGTTACESVNAAANIFLGQVCFIYSFIQDRGGATLVYSKPLHQTSAE